MPIQIGTLIISDVAPSGNVITEANQDDWIWLNPDTGEIHKFNPSTSLFDINIPVSGHASEHEHNGSDKINQLGTVHFMENVFAGTGQDAKGITQDIVLTEGTLSIKKGIVVKWTPA